MKIVNGLWATATFRIPRGRPSGGQIPRFGTPPNCVDDAIKNMIILEGGWGPGEVRGLSGPFWGGPPRGPPKGPPRRPGTSNLKKHPDTSATTRRRDRHDDDEEEGYEGQTERRRRGTHGPTQVDTAPSPFLKHLVSERPNSKRKEVR